MDSEEAGRDMDALAWWREHVRVEAGEEALQFFDMAVDIGASPQEAAHLVLRESPEEK